jgi:hypothetical protein
MKVGAKCDGDAFWMLPPYHSTRALALEEISAARARRELPEHRALPAR